MFWNYTTIDSTFSNSSTISNYIDSIFSNSTTVSNYSDWNHLTTGTGSTTISPCPSYVIGSFVVHEMRYYDQRNQEYNIPKKVQPSPEKLKEEADAKERAKNLLLEYLDEENKQRLLNNKPLEIASKLFNEIRYHIPLSKLGRIKAWKENKIITELCVLVRKGEDLPTEDVVLTKLLYILNDEGNMLVTANHSSIKENLLERLNCPLPKI